MSALATPSETRPTCRTQMSPSDKDSWKVRTLHPQRPATDRGAKSGTKHGRVLVVDDEHAIADSLAFMLSHEGYETKAAYSGSEAIAMASGFRPDMLITDLVMADISGTEAATQICKILPDIKVIIFSGQVKGDELEARAKSAGCVLDIIEKPLHPQELLSKIRILMSG